MNTKRWLGGMVIAGICVLSVLVGATRPAVANGDNVLAQAYHFTLQGNVTAAGVGLRGTGSGNLVITGVPAGATVYRAFLYWATLGSANTYTTPELNGQEVAGNLIGTSGDTCWGVEHNFVYRADVSALVNGNGTYSLAGLPNELTSGNDSQGASLVVIYQHPSQPFRTIVINDGAVSLDLTTRAYTDSISGFVPDSPVTNARVTYLVGDGQARWDAGNIAFNGQPIASNVFSGIDGNYWGTHTLDVTALVTTEPATSTIHFINTVHNV